MNKVSKQGKKQWHEEDVADVILAYLTEHPQASETMKGIAEWWIVRQQVRVEINTLKKVLRRLTGSGLLEKIGDGDDALYQLKVKEAQSRS